MAPLHAPLRVGLDGRREREVGTEGWKDGGWERRDVRTLSQIYSLAEIIRYANGRGRYGSVSVYLCNYK